MKDKSYFYWEAVWRSDTGELIVYKQCRRSNDNFANTNRGLGDIAPGAPIGLMWSSPHSLLRGTA